MKNPETHKRIKKGFYSLLFTLYSLLSIALAVTYNTDSANGPETLSTEVTESFEAWKTLDTKLEVTLAEENPESLFQYAAPENFSPEMLSITVQRQQETRQLIHLISPNADDRKRILLHETGIAIGLTAHSTPSLSTPSLATPQATEESSTSPLETDTGTTGEASTDTTTDTDNLEDSSASENSNTSENTGDENTDISNDTTTDSNSENNTNENNTESSSDNSSTDSTQEESTENTDTSGGTDSDTETTQEESGSTQGESSSDANTTSSTQETTTQEGVSSDTTTQETTSQESTETSTPTTTIKPWETVMNPSVNAGDKAELGDGEKELLKTLNLFAKEDINKDGDINFYDLIAISQAFGQRNVNDPSDLNKDGIVNQADVDILRKAYTFSDPSSTAPGQTEPSNPEGQTGPEDPNQIPEDGTNTSE